MDTAACGLDVGIGDAPAKAFGKVLDCRDAAFGSDQEKLVAVDPRKDVVESDVRAHAPGGFAKDAVVGGMSAFVVDLLETVEV